MALDVIAPKSFKRCEPQLNWDKAERDFMEQWRDQMKAHCEKFNCPQDWELLKAIEASLLDPCWGDLLPAGA